MIMKLEMVYLVLSLRCGKIYLNILVLKTQRVRFLKIDDSYEDMCLICGYVLDTWIFQLEVLQ